MVKRAKQSTAYQADAEPNRVNSARTKPIPVPLPDAALADLLRLDLPLLVQDKDADGIPVCRPESFKAGGTRDMAGAGP